MHLQLYWQIHSLWLSVHLTALMCPTVCLVTDWLSVPSKCTVDNAPLCAPCLTGCLSSLCPVLQTDRHTQWAHWGIVRCTYRRHRQPVRQGHTGALSTVHAQGIGNQGAQTVGYTGAVSTVHTEGTDNQTDRGHTPNWGTVNCTYRLHRQPDRQGAHTVGQTGVLSTVHTEGTDNQTDRVHTPWGTLGHCQLAQRTT